MFFFSRPSFRLSPIVLAVLTGVSLGIAPSARALSETIPAFESAPSDPVPDFDARSDADCGYRDLYEIPNDPLSEIPIYEQGETDLCYAYTAAQLTEYYLRKKMRWFGADEHLSPLWIAIAYKGGHSRGIRIKNNELGHGFFHTAFNDMKELGICDPRVFRKALNEYKQGSVLRDPDFFFLFEQMWDQRARHENFFVHHPQEYEAAMKRLAARPDFRRISARAFANLDPENVPPGSPNADSLFERELRRIHRIVLEVPAKWVTKKRKIDYLRNEVFGACTGDSLLTPPLPDSKSIGLGWASNRALKRGIDRMLDSPDPAPVGIGYCSEIYHDDDSARIRAEKRNALLPRALKAVNSKVCSAHYSLVVGRRKAPTGCQYLVRNTFGRDFWTKRYDCLCERSDGNGFENCRYDPILSPTSDRVVGCWIDQKALLNSLFDVSVLRKR